MYIDEQFQDYGELSWTSAHPRGHVLKVNKALRDTQKRPVFVAQHIDKISDQRTLFQRDARNMLVS
jgi:hypothetical protein